MMKRRRSRRRLQSPEDPKQLDLRFDGSPIALSGDHANSDLIEFSKPEHRFPLMAGKMRQVYGPDDAHRCGECSNYNRSAKGCSALIEDKGKPVIVRGWEPDWPGCGAFNVKDAEERRCLRFKLSDEARLKVGA